MSAKKKANPANEAAPQAQTSGTNVLHDGVSVRGTLLDEPRNESERQLQLFERAVKLFQAKQFPAARDLFEQAMAGPQKEVAHNARLHVIMCDRRTHAPVLKLESLDDHYNYAIERINVRDLDCARKHLDHAMHLGGEKIPTADHLFYALALCAGLAGDSHGAYENLKRAIELNPKNRLAARNDSDFASVSQQPLLQQLLYPEKFGG